ncbi:MAG: transglycosylase domain-containing protein, partial [Eggerthellaceae bacterium]|nr:transglycosylase domain-containing protein [Eggerthellaceae bacterium]
MRICAGWYNSRQKIGRCSVGSRAIKGRYKIKKKNGKAIVLAVFGVLAAVAVAGVVGVFALCSSWLQDLPDYQSADAYNTAQPTRVYASDGTTLLAEFELEQRDPVTLDQISPLVLKGTVATEDERFYDHNGVDLMGVARAAVNNILGGELEGASTITQQFVRNTVLSGEMNEISFKRKVREMYIALKLEEQYSKDEILLMYLNTINYGSGAYGIEAAAKRYYSKSAMDLTLNEAATLIGIPQSPTYNNPIDNPENCLARRNVVLQRMLSNGVITQEEFDAASAEPIALNPTVPSTTGIVAYPYFTSYVRNQLSDANGRYAYSTAEIFKGGLTVV